MVFATPNNLYKAVVWCMWALTTWLGPLKTLSQAGRWDLNTKTKNVVYSLCNVVYSLLSIHCLYVPGSVILGDGALKKKITKKTCEFKFPIFSWLADSLRKYYF